MDAATARIVKRAPRTCQRIAPLAARACDRYVPHTMEASTPPDPAHERWALRPVRRRDKLLGVAFGCALALLAIASIWVFEGSAAFTVEGPH